LPRQYDALILGAGNAGLSAAEIVRAAGLSAAVVEERELGGTCPNCGCPPKKVPPPILWMRSRGLLRPRHKHRQSKHDMVFAFPTFAANIGSNCLDRLPRIDGRQGAGRTDGLQ
jgi:cation diffusion facilitator CzcD-associated flavoprotein CzcO